MADAGIASGGMPAIAYVPTVLRSMAEICQALGVGQKTVKGWVDKGAPIAVEGEGAKMRYSAELIRLQTWREAPQAQREE